MKLVFATGNRGKLREASKILGEGYQIVPMSEAGITEDIPETGQTLRDNSIIKAQYLYDRLHCDCFADDTGLEVDALGGAPGVRSARYATDGHDFEANIDKLLRELGDTPMEKRTARFKSVITLIKDGQMHFFEGTFEGRIAFVRSGSEGFGYDPVFIPDIFPQGTVAELGEDLKNDVSHRALALKKMSEWLASQA